MKNWPLIFVIVIASLSLVASISSITLSVTTLSLLVSNRDAQVIRVQPSVTEVQPAEIVVEPPKAEVDPAKPKIPPVKAQVKPAKPKVQPTKAPVQPAKPKPQPTEAEKVKRTTIAVIPKGTTHEFWKSVHAGAIKAARELDVDIIWKGPLKEDDRDAQISVVEDFISRGVDGICLAPLDDTALRGPVKIAKRSGIPVVVFDSALKGEDYVSFVATDNYAGGFGAGEYMLEALSGYGKIAILRYQEGSASTMNREKGFIDSIARSKDIEIVSANQYGGPTTESAYKASENLLAPFKTKDGGIALDGIFCPNESTTFGMLRALQDAGLTDKLSFVGFDTSPRLAEAVKNGQIRGLVLQNPIQMGYLSVKTMVDHLRGKEVQQRIDTGSNMVVQEHLDYKTLKLLEPDLSEWLD